ncbi:LOW QUALITY PROTEIN: hypothetical protein PHMEG_00028235 [Phytophthora megakarya]|uniref:Uncharacterized protein n=1 Tax=Phytophthora megakarya TaxID=4795 RepID=A0A225V6P1_9STRA|nr:LOW QUALITY PROTEIN: hypothetical protein PHMEG_00028235 [Phytophthora megakarya]
MTFVLTKNLCVPYASIAVASRIQRKATRRSLGYDEGPSESLTEYSKRFQALICMENILVQLHEHSPMSEDALCQLYKRGLPYD